MKYYICYISGRNKPKNNLEKDAMELLEACDRKLIEYDDVTKLEHRLKVRISEINAKNKRSKQLEIVFRKHTKDYFLYGVECVSFLLLECEGDK